MKKLMYFLTGVILMIVIVEFNFYEKLKVDVQNLIHPLLEPQLESISILEQKFIF